MFSFEGDFKTRPKVSLGGASRKVSETGAVASRPPGNGTEDRGAVSAARGPSRCGGAAVAWEAARPDSAGRREAHSLLGPKRRTQCFFGTSCATLSHGPRAALPSGAARGGFSAAGINSAAFVCVRGLEWRQPSWLAACSSPRLWKLCLPNLRKLISGENLGLFFFFFTTILIIVENSGGQTVGTLHLHSKPAQVPRQSPWPLLV